MAMSVKSKGAKSDINVTPYIDILLVLLIIFMVIQPRTQYNLEARVPQKAQELEAGVVVRTDAIVVQLDAAGTILINQDPVTVDQLGARLFDIYSARANKNMFVQAAADLPFGDVVRIIDIAKGAGVGDVGLMTADGSGG
jgi:biopolymer transport protein TolR